MVFSGIVEEMGTVVSLTRRPDVRLWDGSVGEGWELVVACAVALGGASLGCSIAVNGTCLTVTSFDAASFTVGCEPETMRRTNLADLAPGDRVNLERALPAGARNSGHYVQGHVDGTARVAAKWAEGDSLWVRLALPGGLLHGVLPKGFVALDGTSLTVCDVAPPGSPAAAAAEGVAEGEGFLTLMLVAHTQRAVTLPAKRVGARVNVEADVLAKAAASGAAGAVARLDAEVERLVGRVAALEAGAAAARAAGAEAVARLVETVARLERRLAALDVAAGGPGARGEAAQ